MNDTTNILEPASNETEGWSAVVLQRFVRLFPNLCKPRHRHRCRLCCQWIEVAEPCCKWETLEPGEGYQTSHAHPECYRVTIAGNWDDGDWECCLPGDVERPNARPSMERKIHHALALRNIAKLQKHQSEAKHDLFTAAAAA